MRWKKLGRIFVAAGQTDWMASHAAVPFVQHLDGYEYRIYFNPRDKLSRSNVSWLDFDIRKPTEVVRLCPKPIFFPGSFGRFDESGVLVGWLHRVSDKERMYYTGWNLRSNGTFVNSIGLAERDLGDPDAPFIRKFDGPILARSRHDPYFTAGPTVLPWGDGFRMWYLTGRDWMEAKPKPIASFEVAAADSLDGIDWMPRAERVLTLKPGELGLVRFNPLRRSDGSFEGWYSFRGDNFDFQIGYATSVDGETWQRRDCQAGIVPEYNWEAGSMSYPHIFDAEGKRYMAYSGGRYSAGGMGIAVLESD